MKMRFALIMMITGAALASCTPKTEDPTPPLPDSPTLVAKKCMTKDEVLKLCSSGTCSAYREVKLPATGKFVLESHLLTMEDPASVSSTSDRIADHLARSCTYLKQNFQQKNGVDLDSSCSKVFSTKYHKVWTPAEGGGNIGRGSISKRPSIAEESFTFNMMWSVKAGSLPKPGEKFLANYRGKFVVVVGGYETGPGDSSFLGGMQGEAMAFLGADNNSQVTLGRLIDQSVPIGPVDCSP